MDVTQIFMQDHQKVNQIFAQFEQGGDTKEFGKLLTELDKELSIHAEMEEKLFYPAAKNYTELKAIIEQSYEDHGEVKKILTTLGGMDNTTAEWGAKMTELMRDLQQHIQIEETQLFPKARQLMGEQVLMEIGQKVMNAKQQVEGPMTQLGQEKLKYEKAGMQPSR